MENRLPTDAGVAIERGGDREIGLHDGLAVCGDYNCVRATETGMVRSDVSSCSRAYIL